MFFFYNFLSAFNLASYFSASWFGRRGPILQRPNLLGARQIEESLEDALARKKKFAT